MSGPTWLPPKQPEPSRAPQGRVFPRGPPGPPVAHGAALQPHPRVNFCPLPSEQCYQATGGPEDRGPAWGGSHGAPQHPQGLPPDRGGLCPGSLDAEIDSLTSMLAELDGGRGHMPQRPDQQVPLSQPPEEELERLTKKLVHDMNHPPSGEYFGRCGGCGEDVVGDGAGVVALDRVFHVGCFVCSTCRAQLRGQHFYAVERRAYCESCYVATLEKCSMCSQPILDRILRAMGKAYHPGCFTCVVCHRGLDGIPFTVDATSQIHCIEDFHSLLHDAQCAAGPSCLSQVRRRLCELLLWIEVFILAVTSVRSVGCCSPLKVSVKAATHWMGTSCVSPAVPGASRSSQPPSPPIAESSEKHLLHSLLPSTTVPEIHLYHFVTKCCLHLIMK
ncbi:thyroid receptor-interacting protein 6 isoform 3-T3 [Dugong dugon]